MLRWSLLAAALAAPALALAQTPAPAPVMPPPQAVANPVYESQTLEVTVNAPAAKLWGMVGGFCDISKYGASPCTIIAGKADELGAVRSLNAGTTIEILVAKTPLSYTYTQPVRQGVPFNAYHGTFQVQALTPTTSKIVYSFVADVSMLDAAGRKAADDGRTARFQPRLEIMKKAAEGG